MKFCRDRIINSPGKLFKESNNTKVTNLIDRRVFFFKFFNLDKYKGRLFKLYIVQEIKGKSNNKKLYKKFRLII